MILRLAKTLLVASVAFFYTLLVFDNLIDYSSNYAFVHHVLLMDSTFPGNHGMGRAIHALWLHALFYDTIIGWEALTMALGWIGGWKLLRALAAPQAEFQRAKSWAVAALTVSLLMWFVAFLTVGGEWFLMLAIPRLEWPGRRLPHVRRRGPDFSYPRHAGSTGLTTPLHPHACFHGPVK